MVNFLDIDRVMHVDDERDVSNILITMICNSGFFIVIVRSTIDLSARWRAGE